MRRLPLLLLVLLFPGCLNDEPVLPPGISTGTAARMLAWFESNGDYINSVQAPPAISADSLYRNLPMCDVYDIRDSASFAVSHIPGAIATTAGALYRLASEISTAKKMVIVSAAGQSAAYYATLLRLAGYRGVYFLNFGMAGWNTALAGVWNDAVNGPMDISLTEDAANRLPLSPLPEIKLSGSGKEAAGARIRRLLEEGFEEAPALHSDRTAAVTAEGLFSRTDSTWYIACYGLHGLYTARAFGIMHPPGAVFYSAPPVPDFTSAAFLQSLPVNRRIVLYSSNGFESAAATAYLRVLGYNAASLLFGAGSFMQDNLLLHPSLSASAWGPIHYRSYPITNRQQRAKN